MLNESYFRWTPVVVGALMVIGLSFILNLFSVAIGLNAFTTDTQGVENLALSGLVATALGLVVSMFASGWIAGYLGSRHCTTCHLGVLYGFLAWCVALIAMVFVADHLVTYITLYTHFVSGTSSVPAVAAAHAAAQLSHASNSTPPLVISTYIVFCLFFIGALACSFGGHCGMHYGVSHEMIDRRTP